MKSQVTRSLAVLLAVIAPSAFADDEFEYGVGMMFELPHERGELLSDLPPTDLEITSGDEVAKRFFRQGLTQLFGADHFEAARSFREVITRDPDCAMGYWGIALSFQHDLSRQVEYMWYAAERKRNVKTELERELIDAYNLFFGTTTQPEMVLVDSETGKRRARPPFDKDSQMADRRTELLKSLTGISTEYADAVKQLIGFESESAVKRVSWNDAVGRKTLSGVWNRAGITLAKDGQSHQAALAFGASCRLDVQWLKKWDAMPYERAGYRRHRYNMMMNSSDELDREPLLSDLAGQPQHLPKSRPPAIRVLMADFIEDSDAATDEQVQLVSSLGDLNWQPPQAPDFRAINAKDGASVTLKNLKKPTIVVFYLGFGCIHCVEQLNELRPRYKDFVDAGIDIVAIGTDPVEIVKQSLLTEIEIDAAVTPFPILCDPDGKAFRQFHCWDQFSDEALHGTFLIDAKGRVRWRDISEEPFMETDFLLKESKRLLALPE